MRYRKLSDLQRDVETFEGKWELSPKHELTYRERRRGTASCAADVSFKAALVAAEPDALVVSVTVKEDEKRTVTGLVKLAGKWALDEKNRITFSVKKTFDRYDTLTFQGAWEVNKSHEVVYAFASKQVLSGSGKRRRRITKVKQELVFKGEWQFFEKNKLTYQIGADSGSAFHFRGTFETKSILAKEGAIRYQAGVEYKTAWGARKRLTRTIVLFGKWKLSDDLALSYEIEYANGRRSEMRVGADMAMPGIGGPLGRVLPDRVSAGLVSQTGKPLGLEIVLSKEFFDGNAQFFVRFAQTAQESRGEVGVRMGW